MPMTGIRVMSSARRNKVKKRPPNILTAQDRVSG